MSSSNNPRPPLNVSLEGGGMQGFPSPSEGGKGWGGVHQRPVHLWID